MDRSDYVYDALKITPSRFELCALAARGTRAIHSPFKRIQTSMNQTLRIIAKGATHAGKL